MGRDSGGDVERDKDLIQRKPLKNGYELESVSMCGFRLIKNGVPVSNFWVRAEEAANIMIDLIEKKNTISSDDAKREYLRSNGWEQVMTEADGCETWTYPWELRKKWHAIIMKRHGTQHYWDLLDAVDLQKTVEQLNV